MLKNPSANTGDTGDAARSLGWKDPLEEAMATHSSILAWKIPWAVEAGSVYSMGPQGVRHN